jgi:hypothetical protein
MSCRINVTLSALEALFGIQLRTTHPNRSTPFILFGSRKTACQMLGKTSDINGDFGVFTILQILQIVSQAMLPAWREQQKP